MARRQRGNGSARVYCSGSLVFHDMVAISSISAKLETVSLGNHSDNHSLLGVLAAPHLRPSKEEELFRGEVKPRDSCAFWMLGDVLLESLTMITLK